MAGWMAPRLVVSDGCGKVFEIPELEMVGASRHLRRLPNKEELIPLPSGSTLFELPGRLPVGYDRKQNRFVPLPAYQGRPVTAVAAFLAPAYTQTLLSAFETKDSSVRLPLFAYTAAGWRDGGFWAACLRVDPDIRQDLEQFDEERIRKQAGETLRRYPGNRLVRQLVENCTLRYHCPAAQNFVLGRWECPVPTSPSCNARCIGCISWQPASTGVPVTQERLDFVPTVEEIVAFTVPHLETAPRPVISFGQGCEGEPLLQAERIEEAIRAIRKRTERGTININTNAFDPGALERLCRAGLDSIRVSLNSAQENLYSRYTNPQGYAFEDVLASMRVLRKHGKWISVNYFIFPGLTDDPEEMAAFIPILERFRVDLVQMRNLNIDPEWYIEELGLDGRSGRPVGILAWQEAVRRRVPRVRFGYFNPPREDWGWS